MRRILGIVLLFGLISCQESVPEYPLHLDVKTALQDEREVKLSDIVEDVKYVKLETRDEALIKRGKVIATDDEIFVLISRPPRIMVFDHDGKWLRDIGKQGQGPGEYAALADWDISPDGSVIAAGDFYQMKTFFYQSSGEFIQTQKARIFMHDGFGFTDNQTLLTFDAMCYVPQHPNLFESYHAFSNEKHEFVPGWDKESPTSEGVSISTQCYIDENLVLFREATSDTLFSVNSEGQKEAQFIFDLGAMKHPKKTVSREEYFQYRAPQGLSVLSDFYFFSLSGTKEDARTMAIDRKSGDFFTLKPITGQLLNEKLYPTGLMNDIDGILPFSALQKAHGHKWANLLQMSDLHYLLDEGWWEENQVKNTKYRDQLMQIAKESDIEDNPVVRILYLKH